MKYFLPLVILTSASICTGSTVTLDDFSFIEATGAFGPLISANNTAAHFPSNQSIIGNQRYDGSIARAEVNYEAIDYNNSATFNFDIDLLGTHIGPLHYSTAQAFVSLSIQLNEPMAYTIEGALNCSTDLSGTRFYGNWVLFDNYSPNYYYQKEYWAFDSAILEANDLPDPSAPGFPTQTTGVLPASTYFFYFIAKLDTTYAPGATASITGFTNLTLTRLVPEPSGIVAVLIAFGVAFNLRRV